MLFDMDLKNFSFSKTVKMQNALSFYVNVKKTKILYLRLDRCFYNRSA